MFYFRPSWWYTRLSVLILYIGESKYSLTCVGLKTWAVLKSISLLIKRHFPHWHITHRAAHTYLYPHRIFIINRSDSRHLQSAERIFLISPIYCTCWPGKKFTNKNRVCYGIFSCDGICPAFVYICIIRIWHRDQTFRANLWQARFFIARLLRLFLGQCTNLLVPTVHICAELTYITFNSGLCMISIYNPELNVFFTKSWRIFI